MPSYAAIYNAVTQGSYWEQIAVAISSWQRAKLAVGTLTASEKDFCKRNAADEAHRIIFLVVGTSPVAGKLDAPQTITDADWQAAVNTVVPQIIGGI